MDGATLIGLSLAFAMITTSYVGCRWRYAVAVGAGRL